MRVLKECEDSACLLSCAVEYFSSWYTPQSQQRQVFFDIYISHPGPPTAGTIRIVANR